MAGIHRLNRFLFWTPRVLGIVFAVFISLFALDVFGVGYSLWETLLALLMHLIPTYLSVIALLIAWRWPIPGGLLYILLGAAYLLMAPRGVDWTAYAVITGPLWLVGGLFILSHTLTKTR